MMIAWRSHLLVGLLPGVTIELMKEGFFKNSEIVRLPMLLPI